MAEEREDIEQLYRRIGDILVSRGIKSCTMDRVAAELGMSKRTLYEIFSSKEEMISRVMQYIQKVQLERTEERFRNASNVMEGLALHIFYTQKYISSISPEFFRDMHRHHRLMADFEQKEREIYQRTTHLLQCGIREGVFREDVDYPVTMTLLRLQFESLNCMRENFPPDVTLAQAFHTIAISFLRSIATIDGLKILEDISKKFPVQTKPTPEA